MQEGIWFIGQLPSLCVEADQAFNLTSFALSLLLVFRTNSSYSRWLDARKVWGGILNRSRDLVRQVRAPVPPPVMAAASHDFTAALTCLSVLMGHLRACLLSSHAGETELST